MTQAELDMELSPSCCVPSLAEYLGKYSAQSAEGRRTIPDFRIIPPAEDRPAAIHFFPGGRTGNGALVIFIHGGNWIELTAEDSSFLSLPLHASGYSLAVIDYPLAPDATLEEIALIVTATCKWLCTHTYANQYDPRRVYIVGTSAGAHLAYLAAFGAVDSGPPLSEQLGGVVLLSGLYDLAPVQCSYINDSLRLDKDMAQRLSPLHIPPNHSPGTILAIGHNETTEYHLQHLRMTSLLHDLDDVCVLTCPGRNHFDLPYDVADPKTPLGQAFVRLIEKRRNHA